MSKVIGKVAQIIGPVVDVVFNGKDVELPKIYDSLEVTRKDGTLLVLEVIQTMVVQLIILAMSDQELIDVVDRYEYLSTLLETKTIPTIQRLEKFNSLQVLIATVLIGYPLTVTFAIIQIKHGIYIIHTKPVHMEDLQPETGIGNQEIHYHRTVIIIKHGAPHWVDCHFRVFHFIKGCSVKFLQTACVSRELCR